MDMKIKEDEGIKCSEGLLRVEMLNKSYGDKHVVNDLSFQVNRGEILCLLGPNGAGKSTTINILCGLLDSDGGRVLWNGRDIWTCLNAYKKNLGVVPQELAIYEDLSAEKNVSFFASLYGLKGSELKEKTEEALEFAGLSDRKKDKACTFSGGMKRRLNIACAIAHGPKLLIMDEPTVGIDPQSRNHILSSVRNMQSKGITILYTTHYMEEVEEISDRILIMDSGNIIAEGTCASLKEGIFDERQFVLEMEEGHNTDTDGFFRIEGVRGVDKKDGQIIISSLKNVENLESIIEMAQRDGGRIKNLFCRTATLENVFLKLTGKSLRDS